MTPTDGPGSTPRSVVRRVEDRWAPFRRELAPDDQFAFDHLFDYALEHAPAVAALTHRSPVLPVVVAITLEQERRLDELDRRLDAIEDDLNDGGA